VIEQATAKKVLVRIGAMALAMALAFWLITEASFQQPQGAISIPPPAQEQPSDLAKLRLQAVPPVHPGRSFGAESDHDDHPILTPGAKCQLVSVGDRAVVSVHQPGGKNFLLALSADPADTQIHELDFEPTLTRYVESPAGDRLMAVSNLRRNQIGNRPPDTDEPLSIYRNGQRIFHSDKVWDYQLAPDGSGYWVVEPLSNVTSRMIIRNFDEGTEVHHDLGMRNASFGFDVPCVYYTPRGDEVVVIPPQGVFAPIRFYATSSQSERELQFDQPELVRFYSSDEYYQKQWTVDPETKVERDYMVKRVRQPDGEFATAWKTRLYIQRFNETFGISPNGKKMFADGWDLNVLDTATGEVIFDMPMVEDTEADSREIRQRMVDVVPNALDPNEDLGSVSRVEITNDGLQIYRRYDSGESSQCRYWDHACYSALEQAGMLRDVIDIVPFDGMTLDSKPTERRVIRPRPPSPCDGAGDFAIRRGPEGELRVERLPPFGVPDVLSESESRSGPESGPAVPDVSGS
jgi:hypothetical protein